MADTLENNIFRDSAVPAGQEKPQCPSCSNTEDDLIHMIDVIVPTDGTNANGGTHPVWRCKKCDEVYSGRTNQMRWMYDRQSDFANYVSITNDDNFLQELKNRFSELITDYNVKMLLEEFIDNYVPVNQNTIDQINMQIGELKTEKIELAKDPISDLRKRVAKFRVE